jgi:O-antigen/teichoic acid export membrane protein
MDRTLFRGAGLSFAVRIGGVAFALLAQIALARALNTHMYGNYVYTIQLAGLLAVIGSLGFIQAAVRVIPMSNADGDPVHRQAFIRTGVLVSVLATTVVAAMILSLAQVWGVSLEEPFRTALLTVSILLLSALTLLRLGQEIMRGDKRVLAAQICEQVILPGGLLGLAGMVLATGADLQVSRVIGFQAALTGVMAATLIVMALRRRSAVQDGTPPQPAPASLKVWLGMGLPLAAAGLMAGFMSRGDVIVLAFIATPEEIGIYAAAARVAGLMIFGLAAVNTIAAPLFSELWHTGDRAALQSRIGSSAALTMLITLPVFVVLMLAPAPIMGLFGADFIAAAPVLRVLAVGQLINALSGPTGPLMVATGQSRAYAVLTFIGILVTLGGILGLGSLFGLFGAACGTALGLVWFNASMAWRIARQTRLRSVVSRNDVRALVGQIALRLRSRSRP